jgi:hypothetical protein
MDRLALVERYMIDADEAEARAKPAAENAVRLVQPAPEEQVQHEAEELQRAAEEQVQREAEELRSAAERARGDGNGLVLRPAPTGADTGEVADQPIRTSAKQAARTRKELAKAERRAAKHAARVVAAMEKKEARERKALAKAAAKRQAHARKALKRSIARP